MLLSSTTAFTSGRFFQDLFFRTFSSASRLFIEVDGELKQISAAGYNVGPGHGIIVSKINDNIRVYFLKKKHSIGQDLVYKYLCFISQVDEAADRVWYKKFNPWLPRGKKTSM